MAASVKLNFVHVCDHALVEENQKVSLIGIFSSVNLDSFPKALAKFVVVASLNFPEKDEKEHDVKISLIDPNGKEITSVDIKTIAKEIGNGLLMSNFLAVPFEMAGQYEIAVYYDDVEIGKTSLDIVDVSEK